VTLQVALEQSHVLLGRVAAHETRQQFAGGIVDHVDQIQPLAAPFQPIVIGGVPLHQLAAGTSSRTPVVYLLHSLPSCSPQPCCDHNLPQALATHLELMVLGQILGGQGRPESAIDLLGKYPHRLGSLFWAELAVGGTAAQAMHRGPVAASLVALQQPAHLARRDPQLLGCFRLADALGL
jgi:hypothetical protein